MKNVLLLVILIFSTSLFAQTGTVTGKVYDKTTNKGLPFSSVYYKVEVQKKTLFKKRKILNKGVNTDENGHYKLNDVPVGKQNIYVSYLGYEDLVIVKENETTTVNATLNESKILMCDCGCGKHVAERLVVVH